MTVSFDLDGTLIPFQAGDFSTESRNIFQRMLGVEMFRRGTIRLFKELRRRGHRVGIYTSSYRNASWIKFQLLTYGIRTDFIINEVRNRKELRSKGLNCSKYPPAFYIDLHIDDAEGVAVEGRNLNFQTILILKDDLQWLEKITKVCGND